MKQKMIVNKEDYYCDQLFCSNIVKKENDTCEECEEIYKGNNGNKN